MTKEISLDEYKRAYRKMLMESERKAFKIHLTAYLLTNGVLLIANLMFTPDRYWVLWPISGWGIGIVSHYIKAVYRIEKDLIRKEAMAEESLMRR